MKYAVIYNPQAFLFKHECWYKGKALGQDAQGYAIEVDVCKRVGRFRTEENAKGYIQYQLDVQAFTEAP